MLHRATGYYYGPTLFLVFYLPDLKMFAHCSKYGYTIENSAEPFCGY